MTDLDRQVSLYGCAIKLYSYLSERMHAYLAIASAVSTMTVVHIVLSNAWSAALITSHHHTICHVIMHTNTCNVLLPALNCMVHMGLWYV